MILIKLKSKSILALILLSFTWYCSDEITVQSPNTNPGIVIASPGNNSSFPRGAIVEISVNATDRDGSIQSVEFSINGELYFTDDEEPYNFLWYTEDESIGITTISCVATDNEGATNTAELSIQIEYGYRQPVLTTDGWETGTLESVSIDSTSIFSLMNILEQRENHLVHGILIARYNKLVFEEYFDGYRRDDQNTLVRFNRDVRHDQASATKSFTSALLGIAIEEGFIESVDQPVHDFFPEIEWDNDDPRREITLEHMITMSSGIQWDQATYPPLDPRNDLILFATSPTPLQMYLTRPLVHTPGTHMEYSEASLNVVGESIRRSSGVRLDVFADQYLFSKLGIVNRWWNVKQNGWVWSSGDLFIRPRDMLKFGQLYLQNGVWKGEQLIPEEWVEKAKIKYHNFIGSSDWAQQYWYNIYRKVGYSYAWWPLDPSIYGENAFTASGWGDQRIMVLPQYDLVVVFTGGSQWEDPYLTSHQMMSNYILPSIN